jgi:hypothetical protein
MFYFSDISNDKEGADTQVILAVPTKNSRICNCTPGSCMVCVDLVGAFKIRIPAKTHSLLALIIIDLARITG